jgi:hypothetical protein
VRKPKSGKRAIRFTVRRQLCKEKKGRKEATSLYFVGSVRREIGRTNTKRRTNTQSRIVSGRWRQPEARNNRGEARRQPATSKGQGRRSSGKMSALPSWRRAYGALKDSTTVSLANLNSDFKVPPSHHFPVLSWLDSPDFPAGRGDEEFSCGLWARALDLWFVLY